MSQKPSFDLKSLDLFIRVAALGAIGKAGQEFGLSATTASQRIQALEQAVGAQLLHKSTRSVTLSTDGEVFLEHAKRIIGDVELAFADMQNDPTAMTGELRVACSASFGRKQIAPYMAEFLDLHPNITLHLDLSDATIDLINGGFDLAIRLGSLPSSALMARKIAASPRIMVASPTYMKKHGTPADHEALKDHNVLRRGDMRNIVFRGPTGETHDTKINGNFSATNAEAITEAALSGIGVARKCAWEVSEYLATGDLVEIMTDYTIIPEWQVFAVRSPSNMPPVRVRVFTDFMQEKLKNVPALQE